MKIMGLEAICVFSHCTLLVRSYRHRDHSHYLVIFQERHLNDGTTSQESENRRRRSTGQSFRSSTSRRKSSSRSSGGRPGDACQSHLASGANNSGYDPHDGQVQEGLDARGTSGPAVCEVGHPECHGCQELPPHEGAEEVCTRGVPGRNGFESPTCPTCGLWLDSGRVGPKDRHEGSGDRNNTLLGYARKLQKRSKWQDVE